MSLDTVLKIGKIYRESKQGLEQHRYIKSIMRDVDVFKKNKDAKGNSIEAVFYNIPIVDNGQAFLIDFDNISVITNEDKKNKLRYLNFKTSDTDSSVRYLLGDIIYMGFGKESGNFRIKKNGKNSFYSCNEVAKSVENTVVGKFRDAFEKNMKNIETILTKWKFRAK